MKHLTLTLKAWPMITIVTIGLCYLTQLVASWFGINLPDQANLEMVKLAFQHAFDSARNFWSVVLLTAQVIAIMPAIEELIFRLPTRWLKGTCWAVVLSMLFSAAHYLFQPFPDAAFIALFLFGMCQCWLYKQTRQIWCAMLNHALFNLTNLILLFVLQ